MKNLYIIYTHNREQILQKCFKTLFDNNKTIPDRTIIIDDASKIELKAKLFNFGAQYNHLSVDLIFLNKNVGYGKAAEIGFALAEIHNPDTVSFIESDYIFSKNGIDTVFDIFENNEYGQVAAGFSGYDNPDFYKPEKINIDFKNIMISDYGYDNLNRKILYKPFQVQTLYGEKTLELVSNSCGTMYLNWKIVNKIKQTFPNDYIDWVNRVTSRDSNIKNLYDGIMSHGLSRLWMEWAEFEGIDTNKYAALLNLKPSVADHINGGGINSSNVQEGDTVAHSPTFQI
jgi:hypothetical protein